MIRMTAFLLAAGLVFAVPLVASAQTPDGETPAVETTCGAESGAAFGLCNAFCEAMDCDGSPEASQKACDRVEDRFINITGRPLNCGGAGCVAGKACGGDCVTSEGIPGGCVPFGPDICFCDPRAK